MRADRCSGERDRKTNGAKDSLCSHRNLLHEKTQPEGAPISSGYGTLTRTPVTSVSVISSMFFSFPSKQAYSTGT